MTSARRRTLLLWAALALSVCLNVFLAGLIVGRAAWGPRGERHAVMRMDRFIERLPAEARSAVRERIEARREEIGERVHRMRAARRDIAAALAREPFDPAALAAAFAELRARTAAAQEATHAAVTEALASLPPETRRRIAEDWRRR